MPNGFPPDSHVADHRILNNKMYESHAFQQGQHFHVGHVIDRISSMIGHRYRNKCHRTNANNEEHFCSPSTSQRQWSSCRHNTGTGWRIDVISFIANAMLFIPRFTSGIPAYRLIDDANLIDVGQTALLTSTIPHFSHGSNGEPRNKIHFEPRRRQASAKVFQQSIFNGSRELSHYARVSLL